MCWFPFPRCLLPHFLRCHPFWGRGWPGLARAGRAGRRMRLNNGSPRCPRRAPLRGAGAGVGGPLAVHGQVGAEKGIAVDSSSRRVTATPDARDTFPLLRPPHHAIGYQAVSCSSIGRPLGPPPHGHTYPRHNLPQDPPSASERYCRGCTAGSVPLPAAGTPPLPAASTASVR